MSKSGAAPTGLRVLIAGGGVAALETMLALRALAEERVDIELLVPEPYFWYRPLATAAPFQPVDGEHFDIASMADEASVGFKIGSLVSVDVEGCIARTSAGADLAYDALVLAIGARPEAVVGGAFTFRGPADVEGYLRVLSDVEAGTLRELIFAVPGAAVWPLPAYELALQTATHLAKRHRLKAKLAIVTPEERPLRLFGQRASEEVGRVLAGRGIVLYCGHHPAAADERGLRLVPGGTIPCDRVIAVPRLRGQPIEGIPRNGDGFVPVDGFGRVRGVPDVYAAGDMTTFPVKQGGVAAQQADAVAGMIAARAGAPVRPEPFQPVLRAILLTGETPLYLRGEPVAGYTKESLAESEPLWWPPAKIAGHYLAPFLAERRLRVPI